MVSESDVNRWIERVLGVRDIVNEVRSKAFEAPKDDKWAERLSEAHRELTNLLAWLRTLKPKT
jgi:hypothetical protein